MKIFSIKNFSIIIEPEVLLIPEFKELWERDKSKDKSTAYKEYSFIFFLCDPNSPYSNLPKSSREINIKEDIIKDKEYKPDDKVSIAISKYLELSETPTQRLLTSVKNKIDEIAQYLDENQYSDENSSAQLKSVDSTSKLVAQLQVLQDAVDKEKTNGETRRGKKATRMFENRDSLSGI